MLVDDAAQLSAVRSRPAARPRPAAAPVRGCASSTRARFTWEATARGTLEVLAADAIRLRGRR